MENVVDYLDEGVNLPFHAEPILKAMPAFILIERRSPQILTI